METQNQAQPPQAEPAQLTQPVDPQPVTAELASGSGVGGDQVGYAHSNSSTDEAIRLDRAAYESAQREYVRQQDRKQIAALVLASNLTKGGNVAVDADLAVKAAEALLDRLDR